MGVTVRQKIKGRGNPWWIFINHQGKRTSRRIGDKSAAEKTASEIRARLQTGEFGIDPKPKEKIPTFGEYSKRFMETYSKMNHKESTRESYKNALENHLIPVFGGKSLDEITRKDVKAFLYQKQKQGLSANSVRIYKAYLSAIFSQALDDEIISSNPVSKTGKYISTKTSAKKPKPLTWEEKTLFENTMLEYYPRSYPFFLCALRTGMRIGELIALKPGDIDFHGRFIEVRRNCVRGVISTPKTGKTRRVSITPQLLHALKIHITERKKETLRKGWGDTPEWLFFNENGKMIDVSNLRTRVFNKCLEKGIPRQNNSEIEQLDLEVDPKRTPTAPDHDLAIKKG
jgi:integrase